MTDVDFILQRGDCFKLLAACFYEPDKDLFLSERLCENLTALLAACHYQKAAAAAAGLRGALAESNPDELGIEHARLFVGPFALIAPPYGSVYLEQSGQLMGDSTMAVQRLYQEAGLALEVMEVPDHIALELEFLHFLSLRAAAAAAENNPELSAEFAGRQSEFMKRWLCPWVFAFCNNLRNGTESGFYRTLANCLESFITEAGQVPETASPMQQSVDPDAGRASL